MTGEKELTEEEIKVIKEDPFFQDLQVLDKVENNSKSIVNELLYNLHTRIKKIEEKLNEQ